MVKHRFALNLVVQSGNDSEEKLAFVAAWENCDFPATFIT